MSQPKFYVGQEVIALKGSVAAKLVKGQEYTIISIRQGICSHSPFIVDVGLTPKPPHKSFCAVCKAEIMGSAIWLAEAVFKAKLPPVENTEEEKKPEHKTITFKEILKEPLHSEN